MTPNTRSHTSTDQLLRAVATLRALQISAVLAVVGLAVQFVTVGRLFPPPVQQNSTPLGQSRRTSSPG